MNTRVVRYIPEKNAFLIFFLMRLSIKVSEGQKIQSRKLGIKNKNDFDYVMLGLFILTKGYRAA